MNLEGVEKTMLLTLFAKAKHSQQKNHKFYDSKAIEVISKVDYDFSIAEKDKFMQLGTVARTIVLDEMVGDYINAHPEWIHASTDWTTARSTGTMLIWKTQPDTD